MGVGADSWGWSLTICQCHVLSQLSNYRLFEIITIFVFLNKCIEHPTCSSHLSQMSHDSLETGTLHNLGLFLAFGHPVVALNLVKYTLHFVRTIIVMFLQYFFPWTWICKNKHNVHIYIYNINVKTGLPKLVL